MKIVFINLHDNNFLVKTHYQIINNYNIVSFKHRFLLDALVDKGYKLANYMTCAGGLLEDEIKKANNVYKVNGLEGKVSTITNVKEIEADDICIVYFHFFSGYIESKKIKCRKILMGNHFIRVKTGQKFHLHEDGFEAFVNEAGVESNEFINSFFDLNGIKNILFPYAYNNRFHKTKELDSRKKKMLAIGTLSTVEGIEEYSGYQDYFGTPWVQPQGVDFLKFKNINRFWLDTEVSYIYQGMLRVNNSDSKLLRRFKKFYNTHHERQGKYMRFDMVEKLNDYKFFVRPEELVGMPSINMIEGMACGCLFFGSMEDVYATIGLKPNIHYIKYNGEISDLRKKYMEIKKDKEKIEEISTCGMNYVKENFNQRKVADDFINELKL